MARRVHELAKTWGLESKDLLTQIEKLGIQGKRSQSSLTDGEVERIEGSLGLGDQPRVTVGEERVVTGDTGQELVERRVGTKVIRRRARPQSDAIEGAVEPLQSLGVQSDVLEAFAAPEALPPLQVVEVMPVAPPVIEAVADVAVAPVAPPEIAVPPVPAVDWSGASSAEVVPLAPVGASSPDAPVERPLPPPVAASKAAPGSSSMVSAKVVGPRILGRIDLRKVEAERLAATRGRTTTTPATRTTPAADASRGRRLPHEVAQPPLDLSPPGQSAKPGAKRKKRRVIQKPEFAELGDRDRRMSRVPRKKRAQPGKEQRKTEITTPKASKRVVRIAEVITVGDLAKAMGVKAAEVVKKLMESGMMANVNQVLDTDTATLIASEFEYNVENVSFDAESVIEESHDTTSDEASLLRPPVITIMGHVDHGKTSLLDAIRETNVTAGEAGGITQHIGAYTVQVDGRQVTFLDTPGHEAFTSMRARGAKVTDIVVLVVAADDGVMPQTIEAINHARAAAVQIIVAINKIDKPGSNLERIKQGLADHGLVPEDWGGDTTCVPVSAITREGLPHLLEMLLLQAELLDLKANPDKMARGTIIEAKLDRGRGAVATVLVQEGTLRVGDPFVCGPSSGRIRAMIDDKGNKVTEAGPSTPVEVLGIQAVPEAGSSFTVVADEATAKQVASHRSEKHREATLRKTSKVSLEDLYRRVQAGDTKELQVVIKADVQGSAEALSDALAGLSTEEVRLNPLHASVGGITESDVMLAAASNAVVIGFNVRPESKATTVAEQEGVDVRLYTVIYDALNDVRDAMEGMLDPTLREKVLGRAEVRDVFNIPGIGSIAGCFVTDGKVRRNAPARLVRDHVVVHEGKVGSLRRFKEDAREVSSGYECGIGLENFHDVKAGDVIEVYEMEEVARRLSAATGRGAGAEHRAG
jgi:translation initiation factor IF-2